MNKREKMPFYEAVKLNCPNELSCRIEKLLGDCLPENFSPESGKLPKLFRQLSVMLPATPKRN